jgi:hypothetical protein
MAWCHPACDTIYGTLTRNRTSVQIPEDRQHCFRQIGTARQSRGRFLRRSVLIPVKMNADSEHREHQFSGFLFTMPGIRRRNQINEVMSFFFRYLYRQK